jgi:hypothetical protein
MRRDQRFLRLRERIVSILNIFVRRSWYMQERGVDWDVVWDDRGHFTEPHTGKVFGLGTLNVRGYLQDNAPPILEEAGFKDAEIKTHGPTDVSAPSCLWKRKASLQYLRQRI